MKKFFSSSIFLFLFFFSVETIIPQISFAIKMSIYWNPGANNNWSDHNNWRLGSYSGTPTTAGFAPDTSNNIFIGNGSNNATVTLDVDASIYNLTLEGSGQIFINTSTSKTLTIIHDITVTNSNSTGGGSGLILVSGGYNQAWSGNSTTVGVGKMPSVTVNKSGGTLTVSGNVTFGGSTTFTYTAGTIDFSTSDIIFYYNNTISGTFSFNDVEFQGTTSTITLSNDQTINGNLELSGTGNLIVNGSTIDIKKDITIDNSYAGGGGGTATYNISGSTNNQTITSNVAKDKGYLPKIKFSKTSGTITLSGVISVANDWTNNYTASTSDIIYGTSEVVFFKASSTITIGGTYSTPLYRVRFSVNRSPTTISFGSDSALIVKDSLILDGKLNALTISNHSINLEGDIKIDNTSGSSSITSVFNMQGSNNQQLTGASGLTMYKLVMNKNSGTFTLNKSLTLTNNLTLTKGNIITTSTNLLTLNDNATVTSGSDNSYVSGPMKKIGNDAFTFPTGKSGHYHSVGISAPSTTTDAFTAEYFDSHHSTTSMNSPLTYTDPCEYWNLTHAIGGTATVNVTLGWDNPCFYIPSLTFLNIAYISSSKWTTAGSKTTTGNTTTGTATTTTARSVWGDILLAKSNLLVFAHAGSDVAICNGSSVTVGASPAGTGGSAPLTYSWSPSTGLTSSTVANPTASPTITTTYILTVTDNITEYGKDTMIVTVNSLPAAHAGSDVAICIGSSTSIGSTATGGASPYTYSWSPSTGLSSITVASPTATPTATTSYVVTVTDANSCTGKDTVTVTINSLPTSHAGIDAVICNGSSVTVGATPAATGGTSPYTYSWSPSTGLSSSTLGQPSANPTVTTSYTLTVTDVNGCTGTDAVNVTVNSLPTAHAGTDAVICNGSSVTVGASPAATGGTSPYTYSWLPSTGLSSSTLGQPSANPTVTTSYTLTVTDVNGCTGTDAVNVTVNSLPASHAGSDATLCLNSGMTIGNSPAATGGTSPYTYSWFPSTALSSSTLGQPTANPTVTTSYVLTVTDVNGCTGKDTVLIEMNQLPSTVFFQKYAVLSGGEILTDNYSICARNNAGATGAIDSSFLLATDSLNANGTGSCPAAIIEMNSIKNYFKYIPAQTTLTSLNNATLTCGVYYLAGNVILSDTLEFTGDSSSLFVVNIQDSLVINSGAFLKTNGIKTNQILFNIGKSFLYNNSILFTGIVIADEKIFINNKINYYTILMANSDINFNFSNSVYSLNELSSGSFFLRACRCDSNLPFHRTVKMN